MEDWTNSSTKKLISVACVCIMVLTAFHVLTSVENVVGQSTDDDTSASSIERYHQQRRLTISDTGAKEPVTTTDEAGNMHLAWVDLTENGEEVCWKYSQDKARTFTPDLAITSEFQSIKNLTIASIGSLDGVCIAFEGQKNEKDAFGIYLIFSFDDHRSWSQLYYLGEGCDPTIAVDDYDIFVSLTTKIGSETTFSILKTSILDNTLEGGTGLISFVVGTCKSRMLIIDGIINYVSVIDSKSGAFVYGQIDQLGNRLSGPSLVLKTEKNIKDFDLVSDRGTPTIVWVEERYQGSSLKMAIPRLNDQYWSSTSLSESTDNCSKIFSFGTNKGLYIGWISAENGVSNVFGAVNGITTSKESSRVSSYGFNASDPSICEGAEGSFDLIWSEEYGNSTELCLCTDVSFELPNINRLSKWLGAQDAEVFVEGEAGRSTLISEISSIVENVSADNLSSATDQISALSKNLSSYVKQESILNSDSDVLMQASIVRSKVSSNLESLEARIEEGEDADTLLEGDRSEALLSGNYVYDVEATLLTPTSVKISWSTNFYAQHNRISIGVGSPYDTEYDVDQNGYYHEKTLSVQLDTEYQFIVKSCEVLLFIFHTQYSSSLMTFKTNIVISDIFESSNLTTINVNWTTNANATCTFFYGTTEQLGLSNSVITDGTGTQHSVTVTDLTGDTTFYYRIRANWTGQSGAVYYDIETGEVDTARFGIFDASVETGLSNVTFDDYIDFTWKTNLVATTIVHYGTSPGALTSSVSGDVGTNHSIHLTDIVGGITYYYRISSALLIDTSDECNVTGSVETSPIFDISVQITTPTSVTISWHTAYGSSANHVYYGIISINEHSTLASGTTTYHYKTITVNSLTDYKFLVESVMIGDTYRSEEKIFRTNVSIAEVSIDTNPHEMILSWRTNVNAACQFFYGNTTPLGSIATVTSTNGLMHSVEIKDLENDTQYFFKIRANWTGYSGSIYYDIREGDVTTPEYGIYDLSVLSPLSGVIEFEWSTDLSSSSVVSYSPSAGGDLIQVTGDHGFHHMIQLTGLDPSVQYCYNVISIGTYDQTKADQVAGSITANCIYGVVAEPLDPTHVKISWYTSLVLGEHDHIENAIYYGTSAPTQTVTNILGTSTYHYATLTVSSLTAYKFFVKSTFEDAEYVTEQATFIATVNIISIGNETDLNETTIEWQTSTNANCQFSYGLTQSYGSSATVTTVSGKAHSVSLTGLCGNTTYYCRTRANWTGYSGSTYYDIAYGSFTTDEYGIIVSSISEASPIKGTMIIEWETNFNGSSVLYYGNSPGNMDKTGFGSEGFFHRVEVSDVDGSGTKYYRIYSESFDNPDMYDWVDGSIICNPISNIVVKLLVEYDPDPYHGTDTIQAIVQWESDVSVSFDLYYGISSINENTVHADWDHSNNYYYVNLPDLSPHEEDSLLPNRTYQFKIVSGTAYQTDIMTFITNMTVESIDIDRDFESVTINWTTGMKGTCVIYYGDSEFSDSISTGLSTSHSVTITNLTGDSSYWYRINAYGQYLQSRYFTVIEGTFSTLEFGIISSSIMGRSPSPGYLEVSWETNLPSNGTVYYGTNPQSMTSHVDVESGLTHVVMISGLAVNQNYYYKILSNCELNDSYSVEFLSSSPVEITSIFGIRVDVISPTEARVYWCTTLSSSSGTVRYWAQNGINYNKQYTYRAPNGTYFYADLKADRFDRGGLLANSHYYFKIIDQYTTSSTNDFVTNVEISSQVIERGYDWLSVSWRTNMACTSSIEYGATPDLGQGGTATTSQSGRYHTVFIDGLNGDTNYHFRLNSYYAGNSEYFDQLVGSTSTQAFGIMSNSCITIGSDFIEIGWNTSHASTGVIVYGSDSTNLSNTAQCQNGTWHFTRISCLEPNTEYRFRLNSTMMLDENNVSTMNMTLNTTSPSITNIVATVLDYNPYGGDGKSVMFTWTTNFNSSSLVRYDLEGLTWQSDVQTGEGGYSHYITVNDLTANNTYFYRVESASGPYEETSPTDMFEIILEVSNATFEPISSTSALVSWTTNHLSSSKVYLSTSSTFASQSIFASSNDTMSHSVILTGLTLGATYYFKTSSNWTGTICVSSASSFDFFLRISNVAIDTNRTAAIISWKTSLESTGEVQFAACSLANAPFVWAQSGYSSQFDGNGTMHVVVLSSLSIDTEYCFKIESDWVRVTSFTNTTPFSNFTTALVISNIHYTKTDTSITVSWQTNMYCSSTVYYSQDQSYSSSVSTSFGLTHSVTISNLKTLTDYYVKVGSADDLGGVNVTLGTIRTNSISISNIVVVENLPSKFVLSWKTSSASSGWLLYSTDPNFGTYTTVASQTSDHKNHQATLTGLTFGTTYYFKVKCQSQSNSANIVFSDRYSFTPPLYNDTGQGVDAGNLLTSPLRIVTGEFAGSLNYPTDVYDFYSINAKNGQRIVITLYVPSNYNMNLDLYSPSSTLKATSSSGGTGGTETISYNINEDGLWKFRISRYLVGTGNGFYHFSVILMGGFDQFSLDVGATGDNVLINNLPGFCIYGDGWGGAVSSTREADPNAELFISIYNTTYQQSTDYLVTFSYSASQLVPIEMFDGNNWTEIAILPGNSMEMTTFSFVLDCSKYYDYLPNSLGVNVMMRVKAEVVLFSIHASANSYVNLLDTSGQLHNSGVRFENGWTFGNGVANGSTSATIIASIPRADVAYQLEIHANSDIDGCEIRQTISSTQISVIGDLAAWGAIGYVQLDQQYYDVDSTNPGTQVRITLNQALVNVTMLRLTSNAYYTNVGATGDNVQSSHTPGVNLASTTEWSSITTVDGRTTRYSNSNNADIYINGVRSEMVYEISVKYKTSNQASIRQCFDGAQYLILCSLIGDGVWHEATFRLNSQYYDDFASEGALNVKLEVTQTGVYVDWINMSVDSDIDGLIDEIEANIGTNINSADSDNDNLHDGIELVLRTDPLNADTDNDGLMDGGEKYSQSWSTEVFYQIPDDGAAGDPATAILSLPAMLGDIEHVWVQVGIVHPSCTELTVSLQKDSSVRKTLASQPEGTKGAYFDSWDLLTMGFTDSDFEKTTTWTLRVDDLRSGSSGRIEYLKIMVEGNTDPLKADSDRDGILDGEEVDLGTDGWITNPMSVDSDGDGLLDSLEIKGFWKGVEKIKTDPTRADTDGDGVSDNMDICPLGDAVVKIDLLNFKLYDTLCQIGGMGGSSSPMTFFVLGSGNVTYFTDRFEAQKGQWRDPNLQYYFDVSDSASSITIDVQAWADNVDWGSGDLHLDIGTSGGNGWDYRIVYDAVSKDPTPYYCDGKASGDGGDGRDGYLYLSVQMVTLPRVNTIVVNGTDYGLDAYGSDYRYSADEQVYMFYLNCSNAGGAFVQGLNAIIVPRAVLLGSSLNHTLFHLETVGSGHALNGASLSVTDANAEQASSHIIAVISKNVTASQAILTMLTHNATGGQIGNNVTISSDEGSYDDDTFRANTRYPVWPRVSYDGRTPRSCTTISRCMFS